MNLEENTLSSRFNFNSKIHEVQYSVLGHLHPTLCLIFIFPSFHFLPSSLPPSLSHSLSLYLSLSLTLCLSLYLSLLLFLSSSLFLFLSLSLPLSSPPTCALSPLLTLPLSSLFTTFNSLFSMSIFSIS